MPAIDRPTDGSAAQRARARTHNGAERAIAIGQAVADDSADNAADDRAADLATTVIAAAALHHPLPVFVARRAPSAHRPFRRRAIHVRHRAPGITARIATTFISPAPGAVIDAVVGRLPLTLPVPLPAAAMRARRGRRGPILCDCGNRCGSGKDDGNQRCGTKKGHAWSPRRRCARRNRSIASH